MKDGAFYFDGVYSLDYELVIQSRPDRSFPIRRTNTYTVSGRNGTVYQSKDTYDNSTLSLSLVFLSEPDSYRLEQVSEWFNTTDYVEFIPYFDDKHSYRAKVVDKVTVQNKRSFGKAYTMDLTLSIFPMKYVIDALDPVVLTGEQTIFNTSSLRSEPTITLYGSGSLSLTVNGAVYQYVNVVDKLIIDTEARTVYDELGNPAPSKALGLDFPFFEEGQNHISTSATSYEVVKKFVRLAV